MTNIKNILSVIAATALCMAASAQNRALPILEFNPDSRMAGMGGNQYGEANGMLIFSNPTSLLYGEKDWNVSAATGIFPKQDDIDDRNMFYGASISRRFGNHGIHAGFRYLGGISVPVDDGKDIKPADWTMDLAYSFRFLDNFSFMASASLLHSKVQESATTVVFNVGAYYRNTFKNMSGDYVIGISGNNMGPNLEYGDRLKETKLPASVGLGGEAGLNLDEKNRLCFSAAAQYCYFPDNAKLFSGNAGLEYSFNRLIHIRGGYKYAEHDYSNYALGAGVSYSIFKLDVCHQRGVGGNDVNQTWLSLSVSF